jgi:hypothetical protein
MFAALASFGAFAVMKTKYLLIALKLTKITPVLSMVLSSATYALFFGWPYAIGMVGLIFVHELGHGIVMHHYKVPFSPMIFVPFLGASISMEAKPPSAYEEAMIAFGGPVLGSLAAAGVGCAANSMDSQLLYALAVSLLYVICFIGCFNLSCAIGLGLYD